jgi:3-carboxy-cis,cis-muconate cycloisomerase
MLNLSIEIVENLQVKPEAMRRNLDHSRGLIMSEAVMIGLAETLGRFTAHDVVFDAAQKAFEEGRWLKELLMEDERVTSVLSEAEIDRLLDPDSYLGMSKEFVDRVVGRQVGLCRGVSAPI